MWKLDEAIKVLEQKQNRTSKEESGLRELKKLEERIEEINKKIDSLRSTKATDKMSDDGCRLMAEGLTYRRREHVILMELGLVEQHRIRRPTHTPLTEEEKERQRKREEGEIKRRIEEERRKMLEQEFEEWKRKKESGELEFEEYRMNGQFMQIIVQQQEEILQAIRSGLANTQGVDKDNAK